MSSIEESKIYIVSRSGSFFYSIPGYYPDHEEAYETLLNEIPWEEYPSESNRLRYFMGFDNAIYPYSNNSELSEWHPLVLSIKDRIEKDLSYELDSCLINYYPDGNSYISPHRDRECKGKDNATIGLSLGSTRDMILKQIDVKRENITTTKEGNITYEKNSRGNIYRVVYPVKAGDLYVMGGNFHCAWTHSIPQRKRVKEGRISLTFRKLF